MFEASLTAIPMARRYVADHLDRSDVDPEVALLLTSELVTNAIRHARTRFAVEVAPASGGGIRVSVTDASPAQPRVVVALPEAQSGRGLFFVDQYADDWGVDATPDGGKRVWFELHSRRNGASKT